MWTLVKCLILLSLLATPAFGAGVFGTDNIVVGASGSSPYYSGATSVVVMLDTTGTTAYAIQTTDGRTLFTINGQGSTKIAPIGTVATPLEIDASNSSIGGYPGFLINLPTTGQRKGFQIKNGNSPAESAWASFGWQEGGTDRPGFSLGPGGAVGRDVNIYREDANYLKTNDVFLANGLVISGTTPDASGASLYVLDAGSSPTPFAVGSAVSPYVWVQEGLLHKKRTRHAYGGIQQAAEVIAVSGASVWATIANIWTGLEADGLTLTSGTTMIFDRSADYFGSLSVTYSGLTGKDFVFRLYNATKGTTEGYVIGASTTGAGNYTNAAIPLYIEAYAGDEYVMQVTCETDGSDPTIRNAIFYLIYLHD
ncbi:MAG: hypothetical protein ABIE47_02345 [Pseudomonadota bacterium]